MVIAFILPTLKALLGLFCLLAGMILIKLVIFPLKRMLELRSEKASFYFFPMIGFRRYMRQGLNEKSDFLYKVKHYREQYPGKSYEITNLGSNAVIMLRDHRYTKEFLSKPGLYEKHVLFRILKVIAKDSLPLAEGDIWKKHRKIVTSCFHYEFIASSVEVIRQVATEYLDKISTESEFPVCAKMQEITGEIIGRIFFGRTMSNYKFKGNSLAVALAKLTTQLGLLAVSPAVLLFGPDVLKVPFVPKYKKLLKDIKEFNHLSDDNFIFLLKFGKSISCFSLFTLIPRSKSFS